MKRIRAIKKVIEHKKTRMRIKKSHKKMRKNPLNRVAKIQLTEKDVAIMEFLKASIKLALIIMPDEVVNVLGRK